MNKTRINNIPEVWTLIKNHCRTTVRKGFTEKEPSDKFKSSLMIAEHSPIRELTVDWTWEGIPYWVSTEWSRHKFEKFISTQRNDRQSEYDRNAARQDSPVTFDALANAQQLIDAWRKRLCFQATKEARDLAVDFKKELKDKEPELSKALVPNCVYRCGCPEMYPCHFFDTFKEKCEEANIDITDINQRYQFYEDLINEQQKE